MPDLPQLRLRGAAALGARLEKQLLGLMFAQQPGVDADAAAGEGAAAQAAPAAGGSASPQQPAPPAPDSKAA